MTILTTEKSTLAWPAKGQPDWPFIGELLKTAQYEQIAAALPELERSSDEVEQVPLANILAAARLLCLLCSQYQAEQAWRRRAGEEIRQREYELKQCLQAILDWVSQVEFALAQERQGGRLTAPLVDSRLFPRSAIKLVVQPWPEQHLQNLPGWSLRLQPTELAAFARPVETVTTPVTQQAEPPVPTPVEPGPAWQEFSSFALVIYCLGSFRAYQQSRLITTWNSQKGQAVFKYLLAHRETPVAKEILMEHFWPEARPEAARHNLHQAIFSLRQTLRRGQPANFQPIQFEHDCYLLNPELKLWLDFAAFEQHAQAGRGLERAGQVAAAMVEYHRALALYQSDFLEEDRYEEWTQLPREHFRAAYLDLAGRLSAHALESGDYPTTIALSQKILAQDNCHEPAHRRLMACYDRQGQRHLAVRQYQSCVQALKRELDIRPSPETQALYEKIVTAQAQSGP